MKRINIDGSATFAELGQQLVKELPGTVDPETISMSNSPTGDRKLLVEVQKFKISQIGLSNGDLVFLNIATAPASGQPWRRC